MFLGMRQKGKGAKRLTKKKTYWMDARFPKKNSAIHQTADRYLGPLNIYPRCRNQTLNSIAIGLIRAQV